MQGLGISHSQLTATYTPKEEYLGTNKNGTKIIMSCGWEESVD